jgi:hypothetical protein
MRGRPGRGAAIGLAVGVALVGLLILLPGALQGSFYEIADPLAIMGVPLLVVGAAVGALVGAPGRGAVTEVQAPPAPRPSALAVVVGGTVALLACLLAVWLFLWGVGVLDTPPLGIT